MEDHIEPPPVCGADAGGADGDLGAAPACNSVRVAVRVRPMVGQEVMNGSRSSVFVEEGPHAQQVVVLEKSFEFDHAFPPEVQQKSIYTATAKPLLDK
jgi:hypothetical protein